MRRRLLTGLLLGLVSGLVALALWRSGCLTGLENLTYDWRVRAMAKPVATTDQVRLVFLDQGSLDWGDDVQGWSWPWPREAYEPILAFCRRGGAKAVAFDMTFTEPSRYGVDDDAALGQAIADTPGFVGAVFFGKHNGVTNWPASIRDPWDAGLTSTHDNAMVQAIAKTRAAFPIGAVATNAQYLASVSATPDADARVRRLEFEAAFDGHLVPGLAFASLLAGHTHIRSVTLDDRGRAILRYRGGSQTHQAVSAAAVIQSELLMREGKPPTVSPEFFKDRYVFLGSSAPDLMDLKPTPISSIYPAVEIHATLLDNLLAGDLLRDTPVHWTCLMALGLAMLAGLVGRSCQTGWQTALAFLVFMPVPFVTGFLAYAKGYWLPVAVDVVGAGLALIGSVIVNYAYEGRQRRFIKQAFRQYLSPAYIDRLVQNPDHLKLGGEVRELTIHFSDVQGFTTISESLTPDQLIGLLNEYLTPMTDIVMEEGGYVDKYEGDAVIAFWNAPLDLADHANHGVRTALRCQKKLAELRPILKAKYGHELFCRVGINTGRVTVGNMGSHSRFNYTFLGDAGNLASRLEGVNKEFGTRIMISEFTRKELSDEFAVRELARVRVVGKVEPVRVFEPMFREDYEPKAAMLKEFERGLYCYYEGKVAEALGIFQSLADQDLPARAYAKKCQDLIAHPPATWEGVWIMTGK